MGFDRGLIGWFLEKQRRNPREVLYLGGNADVCILVDPCNDNTVDFVSVGSTCLVVIDEVTCPAPDDPRRPQPV